MVETGYLASALVAGALLLAVWTLVARMENWRSYNSSKSLQRPDGTSVLQSTTAWIVGFVLIVAVVGGGAVLIVSDASVAASVGDWVSIAGAFGVLLLGFLLYGTYSSARNRGYHSAKAMLLSAWLFGVLFLGAVAVKLLVTGG